MTLFVRPVSDAFDSKVWEDLMGIVSNDAGLQLGTPGSNGTPVTYTSPATPTELDQMVTTLMSSPVVVKVAGRNGDFLLRNGDRLREHAGDTTENQYPNTAEVFINYDVTECDGRGYVARGSAVDEIPVPRAAILVNELSHAHTFATTGRDGIPVKTDAEQEVESRRLENIYRVQAGVAERGANVRLRCGGDDPSGSLFDCFIASAAYGSPLAPEVEALRLFRDNVLRKTRSGRAFFERFWRVYYTLSPSVVRQMNADPRVRENVRVGLAEPIVRFLDLFMAFPAGRIEECPEPWAGFLTRCAESFEQWSKLVPLPEGFDRLTSEETRDELFVALRFRLKTAEARREYIESLRAIGQLPVRLNAAHRAVLAELLAELEIPCQKVLARREPEAV